MPMAIRYTTVDGQVLCENRGGVKTLFMPDTLGNVIETRNMDTGAQTSSTTYWPYGEVRTQTGTNPSPFGFCGVWGYYTQAGQPTYVRARYYRPHLGRWQTVDPLWPWESAYGYGRQTPSIRIDPLGLADRIGGSFGGKIGCGNPWNKAIYDFCNGCGPFDFVCQDQCHAMADSYYRRCKGVPGPGRFAPPTGGGVVAPRPDQRPVPEAIGIPNVGRKRPKPPGGEMCALPDDYNDPMLALDCWSDVWDAFTWGDPGADPKANAGRLAGDCIACCKKRQPRNPQPCIDHCRIIHANLFIRWIGDFYE